MRSDARCATIGPRGAAQQASGGNVDPVLIALVAALLGGLALFIAGRRATGRRSASDIGSEPLAALQRETQAQAALVQQAMAELRTAQERALTDMRAEVQRALGATEQQVTTQSGTTQRALGEVSRQLGALAEQSARIGDLAKDIGSLHDLLRAPKARGGFGELLMERVLEDSLPAGAFQLQYTYRDGRRVDAMVHFAGRLVPIDAKFPLESFNALVAATDETDRAVRRRAFLQQVKRHVDAVARYVAPSEGTIDFAFMYVPAERVFYETLIRDEDDFDLRAYCAEKNVIPTSPNTLLAYLQLVSLGLRGLALQERTRELHAGIRHAAVELDKFRGLHEQLGKHVDNAAKKFTESLRSLDRTTDAIDALGRTPLAAAARQTPLPLDGADDDLTLDALAERTIKE
jgi:DNA recombination protein RmuC